MQLRSLGVEANPHLGAELAQGANRLGVSDPHIRRGDHADRPIATDDAAQFVEQRHDAAPHDECADQVHAGRALKLGLELGTDRRLLAVVDQQLVRRQRHLRPIRKNRDGEAVGDRQDAGKELGRSKELIPSEEFGSEMLGELVDQRRWVRIARGPKPFGDQRFGLRGLRTLGIPRRSSTRRSTRSGSTL